MKISRLYVGITLVMTFMFCAYPPVGRAMDEDTARTLKEMQRTIETLKDRIYMLEKEKGKEKAVRQAEDVGILREDVKEINERLDEVERKTLIDKINIGAELRTRSDWFRFQDRDNDIDDGVYNLPSNRFRLNMKADVSENMNFHARLTMFKNWMDQDVPVYPTHEDMSYSRVPTNATLKVERAYMDYYFDAIPAALTIGRLPVADGLPTNLRENSPRKSTYPSMTFDMEAEGIALSVLLEDLFSLPDSALRLIYSKLVSDDDDEPYRDDNELVDAIDIWVVQLETGFPGVLEGTVFIVTVCTAEIASPDFTLSGAPAAAAVNLPDSLGRMSKYTFFLQSQKFLGSWFDFFTGYSYTRLDPSGPAADWGPLGTYGLGSYDNQENRTGDSYYAGIRVNFPIEALNNPKLGVEYNHGSRYWVGTSWASEGPLDSLSARGHAWDFYYIQPIDKNFFIRVGHTNIDYDYSNSGSYYGGNTAIDREVSNSYILLDMRF